MTPPGHLAIGYLVYAGLCRLRRGRPPTAAAAVTVAIATQLPDIVDKPLSWWLGVLPTGRTLAHSALTAVLVASVAVWYGRRIGRRELGSAFGIGYGSHLLGDLYSAVLADGETPWFVFWPVVAQEPYVAPEFRLSLGAVWFGALALTYFAAFAGVLAVLYWRVEPTDRTYVGVVVALVAANAAAVLWFVDVSPGVVVELAVIEFALAVWIRDDVPGLPWRGARA